MKRKIYLSLKDVQADCGNFWPTFLAGYITGATTWGLMSEEEATSARGETRIKWEDYEIRDDPFFPDLAVDTDSKMRSREIDLAEINDYSDLSTTWSDKASGLNHLNRREIRIELALRMRGKLRDYAGIWWETPSLLWSGYIFAMYNYGVIEEKDCRYLSLFLPKYCRKIIKKLVDVNLKRKM